MSMLYIVNNSAVWDRVKMSHNDIPIVHFINAGEICIVLDGGKSYTNILGADLFHVFVCGFTAYALIESCVKA